MALHTTLHWCLKLQEEVQTIEENLLDVISHGDQEKQEDVQFFIPQLLQEVFYVDSLSRNNNIEPNGIADSLDAVYDYISVFHARIVELVELHHKHLTDETHSEEIREQLWDFSGSKVGMYVHKNLQEPFLSRDNAYMIFNALPSSYRYRLPHYARRDIVSSYDCFEKYWNKGMELLCEMQNDIHTATIGQLKNLLTELSGKNNKFYKKYLKEKDGCFSLTQVKKKGLQQDVLCFSGITFSKPIIDAINCIKNSGRFKTPVVITNSDNVRYYLCPERYVTYEDARRSNVVYSNRMFSCCERKTFAEYDWQDVDSYTMMVKYQPCELCQLPIYEHTMKYNGRIKAGIKLAPLDKIPLFNAIAEDIYKALH